MGLSDYGIITYTVVIGVYVDISTLQIIIRTQGVEAAQRELDILSGTANRAENSVGGLASSMKTLGALASVGAMATLAKEAIKMADSMKLVEARLSLVTKSTQELSIAQNELFKISQNTRQSFKDTSDLYISLARSTKALGKTQGETLDVTNAINKAIIISGASSESARAALIQLGQGFASGTLRGEELNSVLEQTPRVAEAIAKGMGVTIGQLRAMGAEGQLTGKAVFEALQSQADAINDEFGKLPVTVSQAVTQMDNALADFVGYLDKATGASEWLAKKVSDTADGITKLKNSMVDIKEVKTLDELTIKLNSLGQEWSELESKKGLSIFSLDWIPEGAINAKQKEVEGLISLLVQGKEAFYKLNQVSPDLEDRFTRPATAKKEWDTLFDIQKKAQDEILNKQKDAQTKAESLTKKWAEKKLEIQTDMSISEQDEIVKPFLKLELEYQKDLEEFKAVVGAKELLAKNFNAEYQRLGLDTTKKLDEKSQKDKQKDIQKELKLQEENFRIQARQVDLLDDEADRQVALATLERQRTQASLKAQMELGEVTPQYYDAMMEMEDKLLEKQKQNWTLAGQVVNNVTSQMESSMTDFLDATSDNFADFGKMATSILQEVYREIIRISVVKPLVSSLTTGAMSLFGGGVTDTTYTDGWASGALKNAKGGAYSSPSLSKYSNQIVDKPTFFAFASGGVPNLGVMGEKNGGSPEAIIPLTRTSNGDLGVKAEGMGLNQVKIQIINESGTQMEVTKTQQTSDVEGMVIQAWISGISKNRYGSRQLLQGS